MLEKLEFMLALARERHFGRAAESCGVAQPTFSQAIRQLEVMLDAPLVRRSSRFLGFTPEGERVLTWARRLVGDADAMRQEILEHRHGIGAHIRIAVVPSAMPVVVSLTAPFQLRHPTMRITLFTRTADEIIGLLHEREIDAGVRYIGGDLASNTEEIALFREEYLLLTTHDGPFGHSRRIGWSQLAELPMCLLTPNLHIRRIVDGALRDVGIEASPAIETDSIPALTTHVLTGKWVSVVSSLMADAIDVSGRLRMVPIVEPHIAHMIGLVVSKRFPLRPAIASLLQEAREGAPLAAI